MANNYHPLPVRLNPASTLHQVDFAHLEFGKYMSDHMVVAHYADKAWFDAGIVPFGPISLQPTALALHYGQSVFEGMKAYRMQDGNISIFRIAKHYERLSRTLDRMCMPQLPYELFEEGLKQLVAIDNKWVPEAEGSSLYIRPLVFASEGRFGVKIADEYIFIIMTGPVPPFYPRPLNVKVEDRYSRAARGGTGAAKCAGNYGGAFYATRLAQQEGYDQVLWTDLSPELHIEESGTMNVFFSIGDRLVTPPLSETILEGVTRDSILAICRQDGITVEERSITAAELVEAHRTGVLREAFGSGTAAVTAPIASIGIKGQRLTLPVAEEGSLSRILQQRMAGIKQGIAPDTFGWNTVVKV